MSFFLWLFIFETEIWMFAFWIELSIILKLSFIALETMIAMSVNCLHCFCIKIAPSLAWSENNLKWMKWCKSNYFLLLNLISKHTIIVPVESLVDIFKTTENAKEVEIQMYEDVSWCCKSHPLHKIEATNIIGQSREIFTDFKQVYSKEYNDLVKCYYLYSKY